MVSQKNRSNGEGDIVLIYCQEQPTLYARIEEIQPDIKDGWYRVTLLLLSIPTQEVTWILREPYINGEPFTMGGTPMRLEAVKRVRQDSRREITDKKEKEKTNNKKATIIPFRKTR